MAHGRDPADGEPRLRPARFRPLLIARYLRACLAGVDRALPRRHRLAMGFDTRIRRAPRPFDPAVTEELRGGPFDGPGATADLIAGAAGSSPYLAGLVKREAAWLASALAQSPETALTGCLDALAPEMDDPGEGLRRAKRRIALLTGLADLGGVWTLDEVTGALTAVADRACDVALRAALAPELQRGRLPDHGPEAEDAAGLAVLAMGKMGAHELNYSSDIDIICLFDDTRFENADLPAARAVMIRVVRRAMALLSDITAEGYVFRTDLRLRPDPSVTPVAVTVSAAERYYEALGRAWERAAFVKARPAAGSLEVGDAFLQAISPFVWRRHLDFAAIEEAHDIRRKIRIQRAGADNADLSGRNVKLCPGGIRDIEFFAQTHQLIAGGRDTALRVRGTVPALRLLAGNGWIAPEAAADLEAAYVALREVEHRLQMVRDAQTHDLPRSPDGWRRLACLTGDAGPEALKARLSEVFRSVEATCALLFAAPQAPQPRPIDPEISEIVDRWASYPALRSPRAQAILARLRPAILSRFDAAARPREAIVQFDGFLRGLPAGVQVLSLFEARPQLIDLMVDISSTAPVLARYLSAHPGVLDAVIGGAFFAPWPGVEGLSAGLEAALKEAGDDYERKLDAARRWQKEWHFRIGVHHLRGLLNAEEAARQYADLAEATVAALWPAVRAEIERVHGQCPGKGAIVVGMGSLGTGALTARSDLDLILIYDAPPDASSDGRRPLPARSYYARLTKSLITALSARTAAGGLYDVDMRLRPSGRQGPAATGWRAYRTYQAEEAWTWEHLALTRARAIAGGPGLARAFEAFRIAILQRPYRADTVMRDLAEMRRRLADADAATVPEARVWNTAQGPGGQRDIELFAQALALLAGTTTRDAQMQLAQPSPLVDGEGLAALSAAHRLFQGVKATAALLAGGALIPPDLGHGGRDVLLRNSGGAASVEALAASLAAAREAALTVIDAGIAAGLTGEMASPPLAPPARG